ncbi:3769_t:CDS:2 [Gigaspora margarita]|uniref:3769_t:CDS:1 n=1 Tax=Gigaspora margarita TaxID=4874 RepID=A0ABM8VXR0_GIGMA|nr:3769_t:CDS:2 [Gigaspora margarita]
MNQTQEQIMDPVTSEIDWTNKLNEYKNIFALSTEEFKKFAIIQNEKVSGKDKEIAQLLKTDANIEEVIKEVLIKQECGYQDYSIQELTNKIPNLEAKEQNNSEGLEMKAEEVIEYKYTPASYNKNSNLTITNNCMVEHINTKATKTTPKKWIAQKCKIDKKDKEYSTNDSGINMHEWMVTTKQEGKLKDLKNDKKTRKEIAQDLPVPIAPKGALVVSKEKSNNKEVAITIDNKKAKEKRELIDPKDKEDLKTIQELYETDLNIQLDIIDKDINKEDLTKLCKEWAKIVHKEWKFKKRTWEEGKIREFIDQKIINSLFEHPYREVIIDRVIAEEAEDEPSKLVHEEEEVFNIVRSHFENQFHKRNSCENKIPSNWKERYAHLRDIKRDWYDEMLKEVQQEEWDTAMQQKLKLIAGKI